MIWLFKSINKKKIILAELSNVVKSIGGEIISLDYSLKYFGNIILIFKKNDKVYKYIVDRDEIYFNKKMICNNSYIREEGKSPCQKLIEIIISTAN